MSIAELKEPVEWVKRFNRDSFVCFLCDFRGSKCWITYWNDLIEYQLTEFEWVCPNCGETHIKKNMDLTCDHCGFQYDCQ